MTKPAKVQRPPVPFMSSPYGLGGGVAQPAIDDLSDVDAPAPADGDILVWDSGLGLWVPGAPTPATTTAGVTVPVEGSEGPPGPPGPPGPGDTFVATELDGSPIGRISKLVLPNGTLGISGEVGTYTPTAGSVADVVGTYVGGGGVYVPGLLASPDRLPASPNANDEEFNGANGFSSTVGSLDTNNVTDFPSHLHIRKNTSASRIDGVYKASPAATGTITCKVSHEFVTQFQAAGIAIGDSTPTAWATYMPIFVSGAMVSNASKWTNNTTRGTFTDATAINLAYSPAASPIYLRVIVNSGTSIHCDFSRDGMIWYRTHTAYNPGITMAKYGVVVSAFAAVGIEAVFDWVRWAP